MYKLQVTSLTIIYKCVHCMCIYMYKLQVTSLTIINKCVHCMYVYIYIYIYIYIYQGPKLTFLYRRQVATENFFSVTK